MGIRIQLGNTKNDGGSEDVLVLKVRTFENAAALLEAHKLPEQND